MNTATITCKNCGEQFTGNYCNACGEKVYRDHHKTIGHLFEEAFHFMTHFEGSFFKTILIIFTKPGQLSLDYCNGIRKKYFKPLSLFLLCIVVYLLFSPFKGLNMQFGTYTNKESTLFWLTKPQVEKKLRSRSMTIEKIAEKYNEESPHISKIMLLVLLPLMAFVLYLFFFKRSHFYFDHFIFATEFGSVWIAIVFLIVPLIMVIATKIYPSITQYFVDSNMALWVAINLFPLTFLVIAFKRFYGQKRLLWTIVKAIVFLAIFETLIMYVYHALLFFMVMLFI
jgi:Protein of unknown function (DUF3667)